MDFGCGRQRPGPVLEIYFHGAGETAEILPAIFIPGRLRLPFPQSRRQDRKGLLRFPGRNGKPLKVSG